ncbi:MAG TPA: aminotransferase class I/II-fold pyridoxal phosphate-dependent enzyme [Gemmatimonadales bacterium]|nr:aminotransferase class I/II-fold pyridoxal phosphate-dependent enzyme [Gemmatimonadales bacterium]
MTAVMPQSRIDPAWAYEEPSRPSVGALRLDRNEGLLPSSDALAELADADPELLRRYPDVAALTSLLAARCGVGPERVIVTAGADEAIDRICRAFLAPGRTLLLPEPSFEMLDQYAALAGGELVRVPWIGDAFPTNGFLEQLDERTAVIAIVSPNNPTGGVATLADVRRIAAASPEALVLLDHAYVEYADDDLTGAVLDIPNVVITRTLSKAWGLAGCRVGYAIGDPQIIAVLRAAGGPYPVAGLSLALAARQVERGAAALTTHVARVRAERSALTQQLQTLGLSPRLSQANFVFVECGARARFCALGLAALGVLVREFRNRPGITTALRITLPGEQAAFERLTGALDTVLAPRAIVFDLDGVLADVRESQRAAMIATAATYGVTITMDDIESALRAGDAANDWIVTRRLITARGVQVDLADVTARYQSLYLGTEASPGLHERERAIVPRAVLERFAKRLPLAVVTGRPREEARWFLEREGLASLFRAVICMEDAPRKPDPAPVRLALSRLGEQRAWMIGNTPDDIRAAAGASVVPLGIVAPGDDLATTTAALTDAGAARVLDQIADLEELL